jgi:hypothetical protein
MKDWQAEEDAWTLKRAREIEGNPDRMSKAVGVLDQMALDAQKEAKEVKDKLYPSMAE